MAICMTGRGRMIWLTVTASILIIRMAQSTRDIGWMIYAMDRARRFGMMGPSTKAATKPARSMELASSNGLTVVATRAILKRTIFMGKAATFGAMAGNILAIGMIIKCMAMVSLNGRMVENMKAIISMISMRDKVPFIGQMGGSLRVNGTLVNNMVKVNTLLPTVSQREVCGLMEKGIDG